MCNHMFGHMENKTEDFTGENLEVKIPACIKGDVDELIFPDDEPYYISER